MQPRTLECVVRKTGEEAAPIFTILCHGQLVAGTAHTLKDAIAPLIEKGGHIILDLAEVSYVDSMGLGTLVGIKTASTASGHTTVEYRNLSDRVQELLRFTHLTDVLKA